MAEDTEKEIEAVAAPEAVAIETPQAEVTKKPTAEAAAVDGAGDAAPEPVQEVRRSARGRVIPAGVAYIKATFNNTIISITDMRGGVVVWCSAGRAGFKGSRKSTAFAATLVAQDAARQAVGKGMHEVEVRVQGAGAGRESAIRALQSSGLVVTVIRDTTPIPHNGCRARRRRRV